MDHGRAGRALLLGALVALDAARVVVLRLALLPGELDAVDAAVALVEHRHVVDEAAAETRATGGVRADPVEVGGDELLFLRRSRASESGQRESSNEGCGPFHEDPPPKSPFRIAERQYSQYLSVREGPEPELFLRDVPHPGEAGGLDDQEEDDQPAEDD